MEKHAPMKTWQEWLEIARQFSGGGTLFLLLTGGEPFMYPGIEQLYQEMRKLGLVISFNSNGTLIDEKIADFLAKDPPRRINITLYGASDETYAELCGNPTGIHTGYAWSETPSGTGDQHKVQLQSDAV